MKLLFITILCILANANAKSSRIVNGENVNAVVPFYALVEFHRLPGLQGDLFFGGGSLISTQAIVTVAQNVRGFLSWRVGLGAIQVEQLQWFSVASVHEHPEFNPVTLAHNIAVLRLVNPVPIGPNISVIERVPGGLPFPGAGIIGRIVGFGYGATLERPEILQQAVLTVLSQPECDFYYPHLDDNGQLGNHFCALNDITEANICAGDQGGPIYSPDFGLLMGIQSFNRVADCTSEHSRPAGFLRVSEYENFINLHL